jgi:phage shock protein A
MADLSDIVSVGGYGVGGVAVLASAVKWLVGNRVRQAEAAEKTVESNRESAAVALASDVKKTASDISELRSDVRLVLEKVTNQAGAVAALKERIDGISASHAPKLDALGERLTRLEERAKKGTR